MRRSGGSGGDAIKAYELEMEIFGAPDEMRGFLAPLRMTTDFLFAFTACGMESTVDVP
jgi:hypothetical protein